MRFIRTLEVGDKFRPAHPNQVSLNNRTMHRDSVFCITKVFPQSPYVTISVSVARPDDGIYSLGPNTPVLLPREPNPSVDDIHRFLNAGRNKVIVGYRLLWNGKTDLSGVCAPQAAGLVRMMFALGKKEYEAKELGQLANQYLQRFLDKPLKRDATYLLKFYRRHLVENGLIEEIVEDAPVSQAELDANLQIIR